MSQLLPTNLTEWQQPMFPFRHDTEDAYDFFSASRIVWAFASFALGILPVVPLTLGSTHVLLWVRRLSPSAQKAKLLAYSCASLLLVLAGTPPSIMLYWALTFVDWEPKPCWVYGLVVVMGGIALIFGLVCIIAWRKRQWNASAAVILSGFLCVLLCLLLELSLVLQRQVRN